jgi:hypothetical protein
VLRQVLRRVLHQVLRAVLHLSQAGAANAAPVPAASTLS